VLRSGARVGDLICVSGTLGDAALGLEMLRRGEPLPGALRRQLDPEPRAVLGRLLAEAAIPSAMIDVSDGLVADLGHILRSSGVGGRVSLEDLPLSGDYRALSGRCGTDPFACCLTGGEDYELLFTLPADRLDEAQRLGDAAAVPITVIGEIVAEPGVYLAAADGVRYAVTAGGFDHFRGGDAR
jgi:thiamine-monophosphate kinase